MDTAARQAARRDTLQAAFRALQAGQAEACEARTRGLVEQDPDDIEAMLLFGLALGLRGAFAEAAPWLNRVGRARPFHDHPCRDLAGLLRRHGRPGTIPTLYRALLADDARDHRLHEGLADHLYEARRPEEAIAAAQDALDRAPDSVRAHTLRGVSLTELGRLEEAQAHFRRGTELDPRHGPSWANLAITLKVSGRIDEALDCFRRAVEARPEDLRVRINYALALLQAGRMAQGWKEYEWRFRQPGRTPLPAARLLPTLSTRGDLSGRIVLVEHEEGFGDTLQFLRYLPLLQQRGARVLAWVPQELARLVGRMPGVGVVTGNALPPYDYHCPFISLPRAFGTTVETIPGETPYLSADPAEAAIWARRLPPGRLRVGLAWAGQSRPWIPHFVTLDQRRSTSLAALAPLAAVEGAVFVSLQKGEPAAQAKAPPPGMALHDPMDEARDFATTAAIIANLDVVVSVDTSVVHLAGALGKPVFLLDRVEHCWRWLHQREDSPWYPGLRIFRQERIGDWEPVVRRVAAALAAFRG
ncbi:MAG TPA: tetratricopeptide repeat protein [Acetobacteraceae bacterium]|nr:tetratricopeptide repeat protein [Acetobacteraceae bacterium]